MEDSLKSVFRPDIGLKSALPLTLRSIGHRVIDRPGVMVPLYKSYSIVFTWMVSGSVRAIIDDEEFDFTTSSLMIVLPGSTCEVHLERGAVEGWRIAIEGSEMDSLISDMCLWNGVFPIRDVPVSRLASIMECAEQKSDGPSLRALADACSVIMHGVTDRDKCAPDKRVHEAMKIIMMEWRDPDLNVKIIADRLQVHRTTLSSRFKKYENCTVLEKIHRKRLKEIIIQLENSSTTINEIASDCGFSNANYMIRLFKQRYGCTPGDFRCNSERNISN
jgi:AraC-like DNA-binding protein